jgi:hypothetical protein
MVRALGRRVLSDNARHLVRTEIAQVRAHGWRWTARWNAMLADAALRERLNRHRYRHVTEAELRQRRRSDTVFVFGSGYSLNDITPDEWRHIEAHDTFGFTAFIYQPWVRADFHLLRGGVEGSIMWRTYAEDFCARLHANPHFDHAAFLMQGEYQAQFCNQLLGYRLLREGAVVFRYRTARGDGPPTRSLAEGLRHRHGTLCDVVNAAVCLGWREIVLAGVDLYDSRYFWLGPDETLELDPATGLLKPGRINVRGHRPDEMHNTARNGVVRTMGEWAAWLARERGVSLRVLNPRSLMTEVMPVYEWTARVS